METVERIFISAIILLLFLTLIFFERSAVESNQRQIEINGFRKKYYQRKSEESIRNMKILDFQDSLMRNHNPDCCACG